MVRSKKKPEGGPENESLIAGIDNILSADLSRLWSDDPRHLPLHGQAIWWEVWIRDSAREVFVNALTKLALPKGERSLIFPDRLVNRRRANRPLGCRPSRELSRLV